MGAQRGASQWAVKGRTREHAPGGEGTGLPVGSIRLPAMASSSWQNCLSEVDRPITLVELFSAVGPRY